MSNYSNLLRDADDYAIQDDYEDDDEQYFSHVEIESADGEVFCIPVSLLEQMADEYKDKILVEVDSRLH